MVVNVAASQSGRFPNPGPLAARARRRPPDRRARRRALRQRPRRRAAHRARRQPLPQRHVPRDRAACWRRPSSRPRSPSSRRRVTEALEAFADNTMRYLREEGRLLAEGIDFPALRRASATGTRSSSRAGRAQARPADRPVVRPRLQAGADRRRRRRRRAARGRLPAGRDRRRHGLGLRRRAPLGRRARRPRLPGRRRRRARRGSTRLGLAHHTVAGAGDLRGRRAPARLREGRRADRRGRARTST